MTTVFAGIATIPERADSLRRTVESLLPQVDRIGVFLNGFNRVPEFLLDPRIVVAMSQDHMDYGDAGKLFFVDKDTEYYLSCDDDLIYPETYADDLVAAIDRYGRKAFVGFHGRLVGPRGKVFKNFRCLYEVAGDHCVNILGTGVLGFHASCFRPSISLFPERNMADHFMAAALGDRGIPMVVLDHRKGWITATKHKRTIWTETSGQTGGTMDAHIPKGKMDRERDWVLRARPRARVTVVIFTRNRQQMLNSLLSDVRREAVRYDCDVSVRIYDDASDVSSDGILESKGLSGSYWRSNKCYGRDGHWVLWNRAMGEVRSDGADWYVFLPDDISLAPHFFSRGIELFESNDMDALTLNCNPTRKGPCWTGMPFVDCGDVYESGWMDGLFMCRTGLLELLGWKIRKPFRRGGMGSAVGSVMSSEAVGRGARLCMVKHSLVVARQCPSQMNPDIRTPENQASELVVGELDRDSAVYAVGGAFLVGRIDDHISRPLKNGNFYEPDLLRFIESLGLVGTYVDVGAHIGNHTLFFATRCKSDRVVSVEPNHKSFRRLSLMIERNGLRGKVEAIRAAAHCDWSGAKVLDGPVNNSGMSRVVSGSDVPVVRLDEVLWNYRVSLIKVDVEGLALEAIRSAIAIFARDKPYLCAETDEPELIDDLLGDGYARHGRSFAHTPVWLWVPGGLR